MEEWRDFLPDSAMEDLKQCAGTELRQGFHMLEFRHRPVAEVAAITRETPNNLYIIRHRRFKKPREIIAACREHSDG